MGRILPLIDFVRLLVVATEGSYPPHYKYTPTGDSLKDQSNNILYHPDLSENMWYFGDGYTPKTHPGLTEFLSHSDCDGRISPEMCLKVADELEALLPKIEALHWEAHGHIERDGGYVEITKRFIRGCRAAAEKNEPLLFG